MKKGQALITLIIFIAISMIIVSATVTMMAVNSEAASVSEQSVKVREAAENGIENALLQLLRNPFYTGETLTAAINGYSTLITVNSNTIVSTATSSNYQRKIMVKIDYTNNKMTVISWEDIL